jgi:hypothetical protein
VTGIPRSVSMALLVGGLVVLAVMGAAGCGHSGAGSSLPAGPDSGIEGTVTLGNLCPQAQQATGCLPQPYVAEVRVLDATSHEVGRFRSDTAGHFRMGLAPGAYVLEPISPSAMVPPAAPPVTVTVVAGRYSEVQIQYDTGIS